MTLSIGVPVAQGLATIAALVLGLGVWGTTVDISGAIVAHGRIEVERNRQVVQHPEGGVVSEILVQDGSEVRAGDVLIRLEDAPLRSELRLVEGRQSELLARSARLIAESNDVADVVFPDDLKDLASRSSDVATQIDGQRRLFLARRDTVSDQTLHLARRLGQIRSELDGVAAQSSAVSQQVALIDSELDRQQTLFDKSLVQAGPVLALQRERLRLSAQAGELATARAQSLGLIAEVTFQLSALKTKRREEAQTQLREIGPALLDLGERHRALLDRIASLDIRAPVAGVVLGMHVTTPRAVLSAAEPVLHLVPQDRPLIITAEIAPRHVDEIFHGQEVEVSFPAFSSRRIGNLTGKVSLLSADALTQAETGATYYRAEVSLLPGQVARLGTLRLVPGMPAEVFVQTGARTPLAYLLQPFLNYFSHAFRES